MIEYQYICPLSVHFILRLIIPIRKLPATNTKINQIKLGNTNTTRDLTFVKDTALGFIKISREDTLNGESTNIGMNNEISIKNLVEKISSILNKKINIITDQERVRPDKSEVTRLVCDNSKIKKFTDWDPEYNLDKGLRETIDWIEQNKTLFKPEIYNQ